MNESPGKDRGHNRDGLYHQPIPVEPTVWGDRFRTRSFSSERQTVFGEATRSHRAFTDRLSADLTSEAAETLRSASGGGPAASGEAAVTRDRRDRERLAGRSRGGRGAESAGWREVAEWCHATEGSGHE